MSTLLHRFSVSACLLTLAVCSVSVNADELQWSTDIEGSLKQSAATGKPVLMEFTAEWCGYCKRMEKTTFTDPRVVAFLAENYLPVRVDADKNKELVADLAIKGLPAILIVSSDLQIIERISGFQTPDALMAKVEPVSARLKATGAQVAAAPPGLGQRTASAGRPAAPRTRSELEFEAIPHEEAALPNRPAVRPVSTPKKVTQEPMVETEPNPNAEDFFRQVQAEATATPQTAVRPVSDPTTGKASLTGERSRSKPPAFAGQCLVSAVDDREIVPGSAAYQMTYRGQQLLFRSADHKDLFLAEPNRYWPMLDGICAITLLNDDARVGGNLEFAAVFRKRVWLFASEQAMHEFLKEPAEVVDEVAEILNSGSGN
jgi:thiol-disulfide isomerase/thioredoxin/YHS domain-containing protein